jgi:hypothetical protein
LPGELERVELYREHVWNHPNIYTNDEAWRSALRELDTLIADRRKVLGDADP